MMDIEVDIQEIGGCGKQEISKQSSDKRENVFFLFLSLLKVGSPEWLHVGFNLPISL